MVVSVVVKVLLLVKESKSMNKCAVCGCLADGTHHIWSCVVA